MVAIGALMPSLCLFQLRYGTIQWLFLLLIFLLSNSNLLFIVFLHSVPSQHVSYKRTYSTINQNFLSYVNLNLHEKSRVQYPILITVTKFHTYVTNNDLSIFTDKMYFLLLILIFTIFNALAMTLLFQLSNDLFPSFLTFFLTELIIALIFFISQDISLSSVVIDGRSLGHKA